MTNGVGFSFSSAALAQIERIRSDYSVHFPKDPPVMAGLSFGWHGKPADANPDLRPSIGFWRRSEFASAPRELVEVVSGIEIVVAMPTQHRERLSGMVVDYHPDKAFFLRR